MVKVKFKHTHLAGLTEIFSNAQAASSSTKTSKKLQKVKKPSISFKSQTHETYRNNHCDLCFHVSQCIVHVVKDVWSLSSHFTLIFRLKR